MTRRGSPSGGRKRAALSDCSKCISNSSTPRSRSAFSRGEKSKQRLISYRTTAAAWERFSESNSEAVGIVTRRLQRSSCSFVRPVSSAPNTSATFLSDGRPSISPANCGGLKKRPRRLPIRRVVPAMMSAPAIAVSNVSYISVRSRISPEYTASLRASSSMPPRGETSRRRANPKLCIARATAPMLPPYRVLTSTTVVRSASCLNSRYPGFGSSIAEKSGRCARQSPAAAYLPSTFPSGCIFVTREIPSYAVIRSEVSTDCRGPSFAVVPRASALDIPPGQLVHGSSARL